MKQLLPVLLLLAACAGKHNPRYHHPATRAGDSLYRFKDDIRRLREQTTVLVLRDTTGKGAIAVTPGGDGQVIVSTPDSVQGFSVARHEDVWVSGAFEVQSSTKNVLVLTQHDTTGLQYERTVTLIARRDISNYLDGLALHRNIDGIAFESYNVLTNAGTAARDSLDMSVTGSFPGTDDIRLLLPDKTTKKFLIVKPDKAADVPLEKAANYFGYYDADQEVLTIIQFTLPVAKQPYSPIIAKNGEALTLGSRSPLTQLSPGGRLAHYHRTIHLAATPKRLEPVLKKLFGISLKQLEATF